MLLEVSDISKEKKYTFLNEIGRGCFGKCYLVLDEQSSFFACKICSPHFFHQEFSLHFPLSHNNVVKCLSGFAHMQQNFLILELCELGSLQDLLKCRKQLTDPEVRCLTKQAIHGLQYLHDNLTIHRDLKLANLFLTSTMTVKIGDFGLAAKLATPKDKRETICGTNNYVAPEVFSSPGHGLEVDIWSIGCIIYTLLVGKEPFASETVAGTRKNIRRAAFAPSPKISQLGLKLLKSIFVLNPKKRPTAHTILKQAYFLERAPEQLDISAFYQQPTVKELVSGKPKGLALRDKTNIMTAQVPIKAAFYMAQDKENNPTQPKVGYGMTLRPRGAGVPAQKFVKKILPSFEASISDLGATIAGHLLEDLAPALLTPVDSQDWGQVIHQKPSFLCVQRWAAGVSAFAYQLSNGRTGVHFPEQSCVLRQDYGELLLYKRGSNTKFYKESEVPDIEQLESVLKIAQQHLDELSFGEWNVGDDEVVVVVGKKLYPVNTERCKELKPAAAFILSNGACQMNFGTHEKLLINRYEDLVVLWKDEEMRRCSYHTLLTKGVPLSIKSQLSFMCHFLAIAHSTSIWRKQ